MPPNYLSCCANPGRIATSKYYRQLRVGFSKTRHEVTKNLLKRSDPLPNSDDLPT